MNRSLIVLLIIFSVLISCNNSEKTIDKLEIAKEYFIALDESSSSKMEDLLSDSITTAIPKYEYEIKYSKNDYVKNWLKWDSVFEPSYEVLEMNLENGNVKARVSKADKRIYFFVQKPFLTNEILRFQNGKIVLVETEYLNFDNETWGENRSELLEWITENHPELKGFIDDQTEAGGMKFLEAIKLYENK